MLSLKVAISGATNSNRILCGRFLQPWRVHDLSAIHTAVDIKKVGIIYLTEHSILIWFQTDSEGFKCDQCGKLFAYQYYRDKHLKYTRCVDTGDREYPCQLCNRSFEKRDRLRIHILHVHEKHRPHVCNVCGKSFSQVRGWFGMVLTWKYCISPVLHPPFLTNLTFDSVWKSS